MSWASVIADWSTAKPPERPTHIRPDEKTCRDCKSTLPLDRFYRRDATRYTSRCKACYMIYQRELQNAKTAKKS